MPAVRVQYTRETHMLFGACNCTPAALGPSRRGLLCAGGAGFVTALRAMQQEFDLSGEPDINVLARLPGAMQPVRDGLDEQMIAGVVNAIDEALNELDWEWLVVDYLKAQGASVNERLVGGNRPIIDAEAMFDLGDSATDEFVAPLGRSAKESGAA